jgi:hypothetical protein
MKYTFLVCFFIASIKFISAQEFIARESDSAGYFYFVKIKDGNTLRYKESYSVLSGSKSHFMTKWSVSENAMLYWTNGENVYQCDITDNKASTLIYDHLYWILEFFVRGDFIYIIYNPSKEDGPHDNRYAEGLRFCRINIRSRLKEDLRLPPGYNVTNLSISKDERWASFINTKIGKNPKYKLILFNISNGHVKTIDSANSNQFEWFGDDDHVNSAYWADSINLIYYKHVKSNDYGRLITYNVKNKTKQEWPMYFPERDFTWFSIVDNYLYCSGRHSLYRTKDGTKQETIFKSKANILDAEILSK